MPDLKRKYAAVLFNNETTMKDAYIYRKPFEPREKTTYKAKPPRKRPDFVPLKDLHAMTHWANPNVPFDLYHTPKPIIRTDPRNIQKRYDPPEDVNRAQVQRTRPKVLITPATEWDALDDPERQQFLDTVYCSTIGKALKEAASRVNYKNVKAPLPGFYTKCRPVALEPVLQPYVSPEWRMDSASWDNKQLRSHTEPTKCFWLSREPNCLVCNTDVMRRAVKRKAHF